jgi:hypothetical protein
MGPNALPTEVSYEQGYAGPSAYEVAYLENNVW